MKAVKDQSQAIGEFLDWLQGEKGLIIAEAHQHGPQCYAGDDEDREEPTCGCYDGQLFMKSFSTEKLLAEYFEIDLGKVDDEKRAILDYVRRKN